MKVKHALRVVVLFVVATWFFIGSCSTDEKLVSIAGEACTTDGATICDSDGATLLQCVSNGTKLFWLSISNCPNGCAEQAGVAACIDSDPLDEDTLVGDTANISDDDILLPDDTFIDDLPTDESIVDDTIADENTTSDDAPAPDETAVTDDDNVVTDEAPDVDCTTITLVGDVLSNNGENRFYVSYIPATGDSVLVDRFWSWIGSNTNYDTTYTLGTGNNANTATCEQCVMIGEDLDSTSQKYAKSYLASGGTVKYTQTGVINKDEFVTFTDITFIEVTLDEAGVVSTPVPNGACLKMSGSKEMSREIIE